MPGAPRRGRREGSQPETPLMARGTVKWFNDVRGYGFIAQDDGDDVFVQFASIEMDGFKTLAEGQVVEFDLERTADKGLSAKSVSVLRS